MTHQTTTTIPIQSPSHHVNQQQHHPGSSQKSLIPNNHTPMTLAAKNNYSATSTTTSPNNHGVNQQLQNKNHHYVKSSDQLQQYLDLLERQKDRHEQKLKTIVNVIDNIKHSLTMLEALEAETMSILNDDEENDGGNDVVNLDTNPNIDHVSYTGNGSGIDVTHDDRVKNMLLPKTANLVHRLMQKRIYSDIIQHMSETQSSGTTAPLSSSASSGRPIASSSLSSYNNRLSKRKLNESEHMYDPVQEEQAKRRRRALEKSPATANRELDLNGGGNDDDYEYSYERQANFVMNDDHNTVYNQDYYYDDDEEHHNFEGYREEASDHNDYNDHYMEDQVDSIMYNRNVNKDMSSRHQQNTTGASSSRRYNLYNGVASGSGTSTADQQRRRRKRRDGNNNSTSRGRYDDETSSLLLSLHDSPKNSRDKQSQLHKRYSNGGDVNSDEEDTHDELEIDTRDEHDNNDGESEGNEYEGDEYEDREEMAGGAGSTDRVVFNEPSANHGADKNGVYYINLNDGLYVIKKDAKVLTGLNDPDHPNRTDRYWNTTKKKAFVSLDDSHLDDLRKFNPSIDSSHFRAKRGSGDETRVLKLFSLDYLKYLNDRPRRGFKKKNRTSKAKTTSSGRGRPRKSASTFHGQMIDDSASDGSTDY